jgi:hypothetical protein
LMKVIFLISIEFFIAFLHPANSYRILLESS